MWEEEVPTGELKGLQEIRMPDPVPYTPQTTAWLVLFVVLLLVLAWIAWRLYRRWQHNAYRRQALEALDVLRGRDTAGLSELPLLLRHTALAAWPRIDVAGLTGSAWLTFLDATYGGDGFSRGPGQVIPDLAYDPDAAARAGQEAHDLWQLTETWIRRHRA